MNDDKILIDALRRLSVQTGSIACFSCGGSAKLHGQRTFYVECQKCFLATDRYARPQFAAEAWNRRMEGQLNE